MLEWVSISCPHCGETFETAVDSSAGSQQYVEDCQICCNPILFDIAVDGSGRLLTVDARQENE
jgi:hypothetical protein